MQTRRSKRLEAQLEDLASWAVRAADDRERLEAEIEAQKRNREENLRMAREAIRQRDEARVERDELRGALEMIHQITSEVSLIRERTAVERRVAQIAEPWAFDPELKESNDG